MNTDDSNVEDIPHITECFSPSSVTIIEDRFCLFRTWSFTLSKNDLDPNDKSNSVSVRIYLIVFSNELVRSLWANNGSPVLLCCTVCGLRGNWLSCLGFLRAFWCSSSNIRSPIIGFDFAVILSSPDSFCVLFDITSEQSAELKWLMLRKHKRWFHSSRVKFPLVSMSASWFHGVNVFDLDFGVQIDSIEQPIKSNSVGSGKMSHCRTSSLYNHLDHCFIVFKHIQLSFLMRRLYVGGHKINIIQTIDHSSRLLTPVIRVRANNGSPRSIMVLSCVSKD